MASDAELIELGSYWHVPECTISDDGMAEMQQWVVDRQAEVDNSVLAAQDEEAIKMTAKIASHEAVSAVINRVANPTRENIAWAIGYSKFQGDRSGRLRLDIEDDGVGTFDQYAESKAAGNQAFLAHYALEKVLTPVEADFSWSEHYDQSKSHRFYTESHDVVSDIAEEVGGEAFRSEVEAARWYDDRKMLELRFPGIGPYVVYRLLANDPKFGPRQAEKTYQEIKSNAVLHAER